MRSKVGRLPAVSHTHRAATSLASDPFGLAGAAFSKLLKSGHNTWPPPSPPPHPPPATPPAPPPLHRGWASSISPNTSVGFWW